MLLSGVKYCLIFRNPFLHRPATASCVIEPSDHLCVASLAIYIFKSLIQSEKKGNQEKSEIRPNNRLIPAPCRILLVRLLRALPPAQRPLTLSLLDDSGVNCHLNKTIKKIISALTESLCSQTQNLRQLL